MTPTKIVLPPLHTVQKSIALDTTRFKVLACGRRWGKTRLSAALTVECVLRGGHVLWVGPSYQIAETGWQMIGALAKQIPGSYTVDRQLNLNAGWVKVRSADSEGGLRSEGFDLVVIDECAHIRNFPTLWEQELRPSLSDRKGGAIFISTPKGFNHFYNLFKLSEGNPDWASWQMPTRSNPFIETPEIDAARNLLPALVFRQEYEAEFVNLVGTMFRRDYFEVIESVPGEFPQVRHWDLAASTSTQSDFSVGCRGGLDPDGSLYVTSVVRGRWEWPELIRVIRQTALTDGPGVLQSIETAGTQKGMLSLLRAERDLSSIAFRGITPLTDKITRAQPLLSRGEHHRIRLLRGEWNSAFVDELCAFPEVDHDDQVDGASGMLTACGSNPVTLDSIQRYGSGVQSLDPILSRYAQGVPVQDRG